MYIRGPLFPLRLYLRPPGEVAPIFIVEPQGLGPPLARVSYSMELPYISVELSPIAIWGRTECPRRSS